MRKIALLALASVLLLPAAGARASNTPVNVCDPNTYACLRLNADGSLPTGGGLHGGMTATLLSGVSAATTGAAVAGLYKDSYFYSCVATTWNGASAQLQYLGPDGATWLNFSGTALLANGTIGVGIGANATIRAQVTGTPTSLTCGIS